jgi:hypothetical protein
MIHRLKKPYCVYASRPATNAMLDGCQPARSTNVSAIRRAVSASPSRFDAAARLTEKKAETPALSRCRYVRMNRAASF